MRINIYHTEKFTVADKPVQVGDILKIIPMSEYENMKIEFMNKNLQKRIASSCTGRYAKVRGGADTRRR